MKKNLQVSKEVYACRRSIASKAPTNVVIGNNIYAHSHGSLRKFSWHFWEKQRENIVKELEPLNKLVFLQMPFFLIPNMFLYHNKQKTENQSCYVSQNNFLQNARIWGSKRTTYRNFSTTI